MKAVKDLSQIEVGDYLIDDVDAAYKVLEVFSNSIIVSPVNNIQNLSCEIMSFESMENEGWTVLK